MLAGQTAPAILVPMIPRTLREEVCRAHHRLASSGLVTLSFGNASERDPASGAIVIKPSGIACDALEPDDLVVGHRSRDQDAPAEVVGVRRAEAWDVTASLGPSGRVP